MAGETGFDTINGVAKRVYDKSGLVDARSDCSIITKQLSWDKGTRNIGESYQVPVTLRYPNGFSYLGSAGTSTSALKQPRPQVIKQASITPFAFILEERVVTTALARAAREGEGAYASYSAELYKGMKMSASNRVEAGIVLGQRSLGTVELATDLTGNVCDITFTAATWRPGFWWAMGEGATYSSWTSGTNNTASGPLVQAGVKASERKVTFSFTGTLGDEVDPADEIYFEGVTTDPTDSTLWAEMPGLIAQSRNLTGTSLGISAGTYSNWKGNTLDVAGQISSDVVEQACSTLRDRGANGKLFMYLSNKRFSALMSEAKVNRNFDSSYSAEKAKQGHKSMSYASPDIGEVELVNHPFFAQGEALVMNPETCGRVGSLDLEFGIPGVTGEQHWYPILGYPLAGIQLQTDQCVINKKPNHALHMTGITD